MTQLLYDWRDFPHFHLHCEAPVTQLMDHVARQMALNNMRQRAEQQSDMLQRRLASVHVQRVAASTNVHGYRTDAQAHE